MARTPSVILTPAEKKLAVNSAKEAVKSAKVKHASLTKDRAALEKAHTAQLKELEKAHAAMLKELEKAHTVKMKELDKTIKLAAAELTKAEANLQKLAPEPKTRWDVPTRAMPTETA
jgi:ribosome maturation protein Sdo1